jgi:hypothetical protein
LAANQVSRITAGTADAAGNNLVNLLGKINSADTVKDFQKQGIDLTGSLVKNRGKNILPLEAFVSLVDRVASKDKKYVDLRNKANQGTDADKKASAAAMVDILRQSSIGKVIQDREALTALLALIQQRDKYKDVKGAVGAENGREGETSFATVAATADFKGEQLANTKAFAAIDTLGAIDAPLGKLLDKINEEAAAHPVLTTAIYSSATALTALTAAAGVGSLFSLSKAGGGVFGGAGGALGTAAKWTGVAGIALAAGYGAGSVAYNNMPDGWRDKIGETIASYLAAFGNRDAERALNINLSVDGKQLATVVNSTNSKEARRH